MGFTPYLAMTANEVRNFPPGSRPIAWMSCHFSLYHQGLSNLPTALPEGSLLILDDLIPLCGHDRDVIARQLNSSMETLRCGGLLLDFQRKDLPETAMLIRQLCKSVRFPVGVSEAYANCTDGAVFLPPIPPDTLPQDYLAPWKQRDIWLELSKDPKRLILSETGAKSFPGEFPEAEGFAEPRLYCHYGTEAADTAVTFSLWRTEEDLRQLLQAVQSMGVSHVLGPYPDFNTILE